jgi:DNA ligase-1
MNLDKLKPMLADEIDLPRVQYPVLVSPKLDGVRGLLHQRKVLSRKLKLLPNVHLQKLFAVPNVQGFDGEFIVGDPWSKTAYRDTVSVVMSDDKPIDGLRFYAFDLFDSPYNYQQRWHELQRLAEKMTKMPIDVLDQGIVENEKQLLAFEERVLEKGFEGVMVRSLTAPYKFGRSTVREGYLLKFKRFQDSEAEVIGVEEEMFNGNEAQTNELGRTQRSTAKAGLIGKGTMGALICRDLKTGVEFNIGTGFTAVDRAEWWKWFLRQHERTPKPIIKYKFFPVGVKDKPRHPVYLGLRDKRDM